MEFEIIKDSTSLSSSSCTHSQILSSRNPNLACDYSGNPQPIRSHKRKAGRKKFRETRHPVYRGVRQRNGNKWVCEIREPNNKKSRIWVGTYPTPEMAARAHDVAVLALSGTSTSSKFNFPDSVPLLPLSKSRSAIDIREAAKTFIPNTAIASSQDPFLNINGMQENESQRVFFDEEALYNMPALLDSMAEGLLITPPSMKRSMSWDDIDIPSAIELTLWTN